MSQATLRDHGPTLAHELLAARARLLGEACEQEAPPPSELISTLALVLAALGDDKVPGASKHSEEAAYRRIKRKMETGKYTIGDLLEIEAIENGEAPELQTIENILTLLEQLGVTVGRNERKKVRST